MGPYGSCQKHQPDLQVHRSVNATRLPCLPVDEEGKGERVAAGGRNLEDGSSGARPLQVTVINVAYFATKQAERVVGVYQRFL